MRSLLLLGALLALAGCGDERTEQPVAGSPAPYSADVRRTFLDACVDNARNSSGGKVGDEQLMQTCQCILGKVEQEYSEAEFARFEQRLLGGDAAGAEGDRLVAWSTDCAREAAG